MMTVDTSIVESAALAAQSMPRFEGGSVNLQELSRVLVEAVANEVMAAEADMMCAASGNSGNGYRERRPVTCVGTVPKLSRRSFFPDDLIERCQRVDRAVVAVVAEIYLAGTSTRKVQRVMAEMGVERLSKDQVSDICRSPDDEVRALEERPLDGVETPYVWLDATNVKCRRDGRVASAAVVTAISCDRVSGRQDPHPALATNLAP